MIVLGIETSCDETSVGIVQDGRIILSNKISSQIDIHKKYGGVVPEIASRRHMELICYVVDEALKEANITLNDIDAVSVTYGPGLIGALVVGLSFAKAIAFSLKKPLIGVNHIEGHIAANYLEHKDLEPPFVCLVVSGGHTILVEVVDYTEFNVIGSTTDDAAGEAFDKVARYLGLGYPGGPAINRVAEKGNRFAFDFPKSYMEEGNYNFSFSGLKTAVINFINGLRQKSQDIPIEDIAASFQRSVVEVLVYKLINLCDRKGIRKAALAGGVAANTELRLLLSEEAAKRGISIFFPSPILCTDNAAMIASAGYFRYKSGYVSDLFLNAVSDLKL